MKLPDARRAHVRERLNLANALVDDGQLLAAANMLNGVAANLLDHYEQHATPPPPPPAPLTPPAPGSLKVPTP